MPRLIMEREDGHTQQYEILEEVTFGRSGENTIRVPTGKASRRHCRIFQKNNGYYLEDLGSSNGTKCNGKKVQGAMALCNKDIIDVGGLIFKFIEEVDDPLVGTRLGKYHILEPLGKGGMGTVYRAKQVTLGRDVALKVLNPTLVKKKGFVDSFRREARLAASLQHKNIISIHDFGQEGEWYFFSMEFVDGEDLLDRMARQGALTPQETVTFAQQVCDALAHAHEKQILHQDIKPQNLMIDQENTIKVADLGLANVMQYGREADAKRVSMGTPQYVSPEVIRRRPADARSDIYSLSATLYHLCTGRIPFEAGSLKEMLQMHLNAPPPDPREVMPSIPKGLAELIQQGLSKDPARRPGNAAVYKSKLAKALRTSTRAPVPASGTPRQKAPATKVVAPKPTEDDPDAPRATRRDGKRKGNPLLSMAIVGAVVLVIAGVGYYVLQMLGEGKEQDARGYLDEAKIMIKQQSYGEAKELLETLVRTYEGTDAAGEARQYLTEVDKTIQDLQSLSDREFERLKLRYQTGELDLGSTRKSMLALANNPRTKESTERLIRAFLKGLESAQQEKEKNDPIMKQWEEVDGVVTRFVEQGRFGDAKDLIRSFQRRFPNSVAEEKATQRLTGLESLLIEKGKDVFNQAQTALENGDPATARRLLVNIEDDLPGTEWATRASAERSRMDRQARQGFFAGWRTVFQAAKALNPTAATEAGAALRSELAPTAWGTAADELANLADAVAQFQQSVKGAVRRGGAGVKDKRVSVVGVGLATLALSDKDELIATDDEGKEHPTTIKDIALLEMMKLVPREDLTEPQALGAALYFLGREHRGLMKGYLTRVNPTGIYAPLRRQMEAALEGRASVEHFDFESGFAGNSRWRPLADSAEWSFEGGVFGSNAADKSVARLTGRRFHAADLAVSFEVFRDDLEGQAGIVLQKDEQNFLAAWLLGEKAILQFTRNGSNERAEGAFGEGRWRLRIQNGKAQLLRDDSPVADLDIAGMQDWEVELRLEINATPGHFDNITIEEGPDAAEGSVRAW